MTGGMPYRRTFKTLLMTATHKMAIDNGSTVKLSLAVMFLFYFALNTNAQEVIVFLTAKVLLLHFTK